jgi:hypothetical protein
MRSVGRKGREWCVALLLGLVCIGGFPRTAAAGDDVAESAPFRVRGLKSETLWAVRRVLAAADRRLDRAACLEVLTDFRDASGRTLREVLDAHEVTARGYLRWISFADGGDSRPCRSRGTLAATEPTSRVVFICPKAFVEAASATPEDAEATLIHEMLHSLGLGENPPSSREITERVRARCGSTAAPDVGTPPRPRF